MAQKNKKAIQRALVGHVEVCEACGYEGGFHIVLDLIRKKPPGNVKLTLKCPSCGQMYDLGLVISTAGEKDK